MKHDPHDPQGVKLQAIVDAIVALAHDRGMKYEMTWREVQQHSVRRSAGCGAESAV